MTSRIGSRPPAGFTLVEVMVTAAVLATGIVFLFRSLFSSLDAAVYARDRLSTMLWIDTKIQQDNEALCKDSAIVRPYERGRFVYEGRDFNWTRSLQTCGLVLDTAVTVIWKEAGRPRRLDVASALCPLKTITYNESCHSASPPVDNLNECS